mmetsp:Transcript_48479/g.152330  ORF Transcript_48479/g.152330 Transcript_48479/m.152330 type:complete len:487 (-) Transcript_48479:2-1462(-)
MRTVGCVGDSLTRNGYPVHLRKLLEEGGGLFGGAPEVSDFAVDGATATCCIDAYLKKSTFREALRYGADIYIVLLGTNDSKVSIWHEPSFLRDYIAIVGELLLSSARERPPAILLVTPPPLASENTLGMQLHVVNELLPRLVTELAERLKLDVVDAFGGLGGASQVYPSEFHQQDGCHLNQHGDKVLAGLIRDSLLCLAESPPDTASVVHAFKSTQLRQSLRPGAVQGTRGELRLMDEVEGRTAAALLAYTGEGLRLVGYCNRWRCQEDAFCFACVPPGEACTGGQSDAAAFTGAAAMPPVGGAWRHQLTVMLESGCLSFQAIGCEQLFRFRVFPVGVGTDGFYRLERGNPSAVRAAIGGEGDGHGSNFFIEEAAGTVVTIYVELLESSSAMVLRSGRVEACGAGGTLCAAAVWYVTEHQRDRLLQPVRASQAPGRQAPKQGPNSTHKFDTYYRYLMTDRQGQGAQIKAMKRDRLARSPPIQGLER